MARRAPNNYGCITKLKGNRSRPWVVKITVYDKDGNGKQKPIAYAETEEKARITLAKYNNNPWNIDRETVTLADLYARWSEIKRPRLGTSLQSSLKSAYKHCQKYYGMKYRAIKSYHMQECIDNCGRGSSTQSNIKCLWSHLDNFAFELDIIDKMYSQLTTAAPPPETTKTPFTKDQVDALWKIKDQPWVDTVLMYLYTGFRLNELLGMKSDQVNTTEWYFQNGLKSAAGRGRIVPIHPRIRPLVEHRLAEGNEYFISENNRRIDGRAYYDNWYSVMDLIGAKKTPHEARHTFETFLDNEKGNRKCIDMLMGHKSKDVGNRVYNHKTIEQLRETINLLK